MPAPSDPTLYREAKDFIESKYKTNSPFRSGAVVKHYKQLYKKKHNSDDSYTETNHPKNLKRFFEEKWVSVNPTQNKGGYPVFRPTRKVNAKTPQLLQEIPDNILQKQINLKQSYRQVKRLPKYTTVIHHAKKGGALEVGTLKNLLKASYDKKTRETDGFQKDQDLSTKTSKVYYNPETNQTVVAHKGTTGFTDWFNNLAYAVGGETLYKTTDRYKQAKKVQKSAQQKYGRDNITTVGHSQGGLQAELLGKKGKEIITLNKATKPFGNTRSKNQYDIRAEGDYVSSFNPFQVGPKNETTIKSEHFNPLAEHGLDTLDRLDSKQKIGGMIVRRFYN